MSKEAFYLESSRYYIFTNPILISNLRKMIKRIAVSLTLAVLVVGTSFAQDKVQVQDSDVILMVKFASADESVSKSIKDVKGSKLVSTDGSSTFYFATSKDASESAIKEIKGMFGEAKMKVSSISAAEYKKQTVKGKK